MGYAAPSLKSQMKKSNLQSKFIHEQNHHTEKVRSNVERSEEDYEIEEGIIHIELPAFQIFFISEE